MKRLITDEKGSAVVEFAIMAPLAITALFWFMDVAYAFQARNAFVHSVNDVARQVYLDPDITDEEMLTILEENLEGFIQNITIELDTTLSEGLDYRLIEASGIYEFKAPPFSGRQITLIAQSRAPVLRYN